MLHQFPCLLLTHGKGVEDISTRGGRTLHKGEKEHIKMRTWNLKWVLVVENTGVRVNWGVELGKFGGFR